MSEFVPFRPRRSGSRSAKVGWITDENGCDIWQGAKSKGYGQVRIGDTICLVHRVRYEMEIGPIPDGMDLDHYVCDNGAGACCNPYHCRPIDPLEHSILSAKLALAK